MHIWSLCDVSPELIGVCFPNAPLFGETADLELTAKFDSPGGWVVNRCDYVGSFGTESLNWCSETRMYCTRDRGASSWNEGPTLCVLPCHAHSWGRLYSDRWGQAQLRVNDTAENGVSRKILFDIFNRHHKLLNAWITADKIFALLQSHHPNMKRSFQRWGNNFCRPSVTFFTWKFWILMKFWNVITQQLSSDCYKRSVAPSLHNHYDVNK